MKKIFNSSELKIFWDGMSKVYSNNIDQNLLPTYLNLTNICKVFNLTENDNILELSVGTGIGFSLLPHLTKANIYGGDISEKMVEITKKNIEGKRIKELSVLNNEKLSKYKDNYFANVISNFSLHLVENPMNMLNESKRVLDKNNKNSSICFSIQGRPENCKIFSVVPETLKSMNVNIPNTRSFFYLSDKDKIYSLCKEAQFKNIYIDYMTTINNFQNADELLFFLNTPFYSNILLSLKERQSEVIERIRSNYEKLLVENGRLKFESIIIHLS